MSDQTPKEGAERWNYLSEGLRAENAALTARCEALTAERDQWKAQAAGAAYDADERDALNARCQHLEQAVKIGRLFAVKLRAKDAGWEVEAVSVIEQIDAALASLLPSAEPTPR